MQLCGLVLEFDPQRQISDAVLCHLNNMVQCTLGQVIENRLPLVLETDTAEDAQRWHDELACLEGVQQVHVAYVAFEDDCTVEQEAHHVA
ncbi:MAG: hypothetical protein JNJ77_10090 [Planctomycetia bacterium]|nr:hypothetical protein [Planctomycetia bacterium]